MKPLFEDIDSKRGTNSYVAYRYGDASAQHQIRRARRLNELARLCWDLNDCGPRGAIADACFGSGCERVDRARRR